MKQLTIIHSLEFYEKIILFITIYRQVIIAKTSRAQFERFFQDLCIVIYRNGSFHPYGICDKSPLYVTYAR